ncbi:MAG: acyl--CoA ligase [Proteobacteria bacterium]|nr:acyl--CoA ligase [Pseudomonadota bacterium]
MKFETLTLGCVLKTVSHEHSNKTAIIFEDNQLSYAHMFKHSKNLALSFKKMGIQKDDKVAIILPNCLEYMYIYFALFMIGAWAVPMSTRWEEEELNNVLKDSESTTVIYKNRIGILSYSDIFSHIKDDLPLLKNYILLENDVPETRHSLNEMIYCEFKDIGPDHILNQSHVAPDDVALLAYTSGTTGRPKGVMISHKTLVLTSYHTQKIWGTGHEVAFSVAPLYAAQGFLAVLIDLVAGVTMKWHLNFNPHDILLELAKGDINTFHTQPTMWSLLLMQPYITASAFSHLNKVIVSGSLCSPALAKRIEQNMGCTLLNAYGLIEATGVVTLTHPDDPDDIRLNTVGRPIPGVEIKIVDVHTRQELKNGGIGELAVRGYLMKGYYRNDTKTSEVIDENGWLYTGDLACVHDGLNIKIMGRCKDMIIRGGFNVYPTDIEECLIQLDAIEDVSVVGRPDDLLGESIVAFVIPNPGESLSQGDVKRFCRGKISNYKIPDEVIFVSQFPILLSGKVQKNILKDWAENDVPDDCRMMFEFIQ